MYIFFYDFSQVCTGIDLSSKDVKRFREEVLPEAVNNMFLVTRRIQARYAKIPDRAVSFFSFKQSEFTGLDINLSRQTSS